jgi:hypothetical protein
MGNFLEIVSANVDSLYYSLKAFLKELLYKESLLGKDAADLLADPKTRQEFIKFTNNESVEGVTEDNENKLRQKTFQKSNGEEVTIISHM